MPSEQFGPYRLDELIGRGGMGEVYRAYDTVKGRTVALKRLPAHLASDREYQARFRREAKVTARLTEPHIVPIHDYGEIDGQLFIDMRLIVGIDLAALIQKTGPLAPARAVAITAQVASALGAAHAEGLTHRDVKPSNILIPGGEHGEDFVYLVDFGIARDGTATVMTATGAHLGTVEYMAPERLLHGHCDHRVDTYALGCVLFELLTGTRPFPATTLAGQMYAHVHTAPPLPSRHQPALPARLDSVVAQAMAKDPEQRHHPITELGSAAYQALTVPGHTGQRTARRPPGRPEIAATRPFPPTGTAPVRRRRRRLIPSAVLITAAVGGAAAAVLLGNRNTDPPPTPITSASPPAVPAARIAPVVTVEIPAGANAADVVVTRDGRHVYISSQAPTGGSISVLDTATNQMSAVIPVKAGTDRVAITPDGHHAYLTNNVAAGAAAGGVVSVLDLAANAITATISVNKPADVAITPDGRQAYVTENAAPGAVSVIDTATNTVATRIPVGAKPDGVAITPDGRHAYVTNQNSNTVSVIDTGRNAVTITIATGENPIGVAITPDGRHAYIANRAPAGTVTVIDTLTHRAIATVPAGRAPINVAIAPDGHLAYVTNIQANTVSVIDTATNAVRYTIPVGRKPNGLAIAPDGRHAYIANQDSGTVSVIDTGSR
ncbi:MAG TPA: serine/threonine-protein kinase [Pseudonocardia sp.]